MAYLFCCASRPRTQSPNTLRHEPVRTQPHPKPTAVTFSKDAAKVPPRSPSPFNRGTLQAEAGPAQRPVEQRHVTAPSNQNAQIMANLKGWKLLTESFRGNTYYAATASRSELFVDYSSGFISYETLETYIQKAKQQSDHDTSPDALLRAFSRLDSQYYLNRASHSRGQVLRSKTSPQVRLAPARAVSDTAEHDFRHNLILMVLSTQELKQITHQYGPANANTLLTNLHDAIVSSSLKTTELKDLFTALDKNHNEFIHFLKPGIADKLQSECIIPADPNKLQLDEAINLWRACGRDCRRLGNLFLNVETSLLRQLAAIATNNHLLIQMVWNTHSNCDFDVFLSSLTKEQISQIQQSSEALKLHLEIWSRRNHGVPICFNEEGSITRHIQLSGRSIQSGQPELFPLSQSSYRLRGSRGSIASEFAIGSTPQRPRASSLLSLANPGDLWAASPQTIHLNHSNQRWTQYPAHLSPGQSRELLPRIGRHRQTRPASRILYSEH